MGGEKWRIIEVYTRKEELKTLGELERWKARKGKKEC